MLISLVAVASSFSSCARPARCGASWVPSPSERYVASRIPRRCEEVPGGGGRSLPEQPRRSAAALSVTAVTAALLWQQGIRPARAQKKPPKPVVAQDKNFQPVELGAWLKSSKGQPDLVLGLRGEPYFLMPGKDGGALRNFAFRAECTHLGCLVNWSRVQNKFVCPCHGSEYDDQGSVIKGPAPKNLSLAHVELTESNKVRLVAWTEEDFRDGSAPWWLA
eukprot:TRINITY_DN43462_c0_g1_i1.p2 TRINITY_DN43462_c0_g1~~TRINITY_DN43462_c0_g1_i1.p2  ORF type:complete len:220 (+),score=40.11 TRINITY_DN43462_c0_g1_i1:37-696(+)